MEQEEQITKMPTEDLSYFQEEEFKRNLRSYEQMLQGGQSVYLEADELTDIAEYYLVRNETEKAMDCIDYALHLHPGSIDPLIFLARQKMFNGDIEEARTIRNCISDPNDREVIFFDAEIMLREGRVQEAIQFLTDKAETEEDDLAMFFYDTATLFLDYECLEQAEKWGRKALDMEPDNEKFIKFKADYLLASNQPQEAISILNSLLDNNPYNSNAWHALGEAYFANEEYQKTLEAADFALAIDEHDAQALLLKANCQFQLQNFEEAHRIYRRYFQEFHSNEVPYLFDGVCLAAQGRNEEALNQLLKADSLSKGISVEQQHIYANLSDVYSKLHDTARAFEYIDKIKELNPDYDADLYKGHVMMQNDDQEAAAEYYQRSISNHKDKLEAHLLVGMSLVENKAFNDGRKHFLFILEKDKEKGPHSQKAYAYLAYCAMMQNQHQEFLYYLKIACKEAPDILEYTVGRYIPEEVEPEDFYYYVVTHGDIFWSFDPEHPIA